MAAPGGGGWGGGGWGNDDDNWGGWGPGRNHDGHDGHDDDDYDDDQEEATDDDYVTQDLRWCRSCRTCAPAPRRAAFSSRAGLDQERLTGSPRWLGLLEGLAGSGETRGFSSLVGSGEAQGLSSLALYPQEFVVIRGDLGVLLIGWIMRESRALLIGSASSRASRDQERPKGAPHLLDQERIAQGFSGSRDQEFEGQESNSQLVDQEFAVIRRVCTHASLLLSFPCCSKLVWHIELFAPLQEELGELQAQTDNWGRRVHQHPLPPVLGARQVEDHRGLEARYAEKSGCAPQRERQRERERDEREC